MRHWTIVKGLSEYRRPMAYAGAVLFKPAASVRKYCNVKFLNFTRRAAKAVDDLPLPS
jgi:hypothetical protein